MTTAAETSLRVGIDLGGSKIAMMALDGTGAEIARSRRPTPTSHGSTLQAIEDIVRGLTAEHGPISSLGIGMPGVIQADGTCVRAVNLPWLEGRSLADDLRSRLALPVGVANDANCFVLSEATDGAARGADVVFGATLGTGIGGGIVAHGRILSGANALAGEWGHNPLPLTSADGEPMRCHCGRIGCVETWLNGAALARDLERCGGPALDGMGVGDLAVGGDPAALRAITRYAQRLARALASVINLLDPDVIVLGGGLSKLPNLVPRVAESVRPHVVGDTATALRLARFGPESGLRGAAWLGSGPRPSTTAPSR